MLGIRRSKSKILEEKSRFADNIKDIWKHENYEGIKIAHNDIVEYLQEKNFDFFSVQYLLTMTYMELLIGEYMDSHKSEIEAKIKAMVEGNAKMDTPK